MKVKVISVLEDNYMYLVIEEHTREAVAVDVAVPKRVRDGRGQPGVPLQASAALDATHQIPYLAGADCPNPYSDFWFPDYLRLPYVKAALACVAFVVLNCPGRSVIAGHLPSPALSRVLAALQYGRGRPTRTSKSP